MKEGQGVARGETLATRLFNHPAGTHLHFEIRNHATSAWEDGTPGIAQDPLATPNIFPVPSKTRLPKLLQIGLTHKNPGKEVFSKTTSPDFGSGPPYFFAKFIDPEDGRTLGLRAMRLEPEVTLTSAVDTPPM